MGDAPKWTDRFALWFVGQPYGKRYLMSVAMASAVILTPTLLLTPAHSGGGRQTAGSFEFTCSDPRQGDHQVSVNLPTDPNRIDEMNAHPEQFVDLFRTACPTY
jgi:hypothetical protein